MWTWNRHIDQMVSDGLHIKVLQKLQINLSCCSAAAQQQLPPVIVTLQSRSGWDFVLPLSGLWSQVSVWPEADAASVVVFMSSVRTRTAKRLPIKLTLSSCRSPDTAMRPMTGAPPPPPPWRSILTWRTTLMTEIHSSMTLFLNHRRPTAGEDAWTSRLNYMFPCSQAATFKIWPHITVVSYLTVIGAVGVWPRPHSTLCFPVWTYIKVRFTQTVNRTLCSEK